MSPAEARKFTMQKRRAYFPAITALEMNASPLFSMAAKQALIQLVQIILCRLRNPDWHEVLEGRSAVS